MVVRTARYGELTGTNRPSFYATPVAWAAADFARQLIAQEGEVEPHDTGIVVVSDQCSLRTIRELASSAAHGSISPLRFAGASPSIVAGLPALQQGIRGPTVALTMPPEHAPSAVLALICQWIVDCGIGAVIAITHFERRDQRHEFKGLVARSAGGELRSAVAQLCRRMEQPCAAETLLSRS